MIYSQSGGNMGIGFAIPSNVAKFVMTQLIEKGKVVRGYLGLVPIDLTPVTSNKLGAKQGALVEDVSKDSPADKAGVKRLDVITKINGQVIPARSLKAVQPGDFIWVPERRDVAGHRPRRGQLAAHRELPGRGEQRPNRWRDRPRVLHSFRQQ